MSTSWLNTFRTCRCSESKRVRRLAGVTFRCYGCGEEFPEGLWHVYSVTHGPLEQTMEYKCGTCGKFQQQVVREAPSHFNKTACRSERSRSYSLDTRRRKPPRSKSDSIARRIRFVSS